MSRSNGSSGSRWTKFGRDSKERNATLARIGKRADALGNTRMYRVRRCCIISGSPHHSFKVPPRAPLPSDQAAFASRDASSPGRRRRRRADSEARDGGRTVSSAGSGFSESRTVRWTVQGSDASCAARGLRQIDPIRGCRCLSRAIDNRQKCSRFALAD